jgi:hypothetical protein
MIKIYILFFILHLCSCHTLKPVGKQWEFISADGNFVENRSYEVLNMRLTGESPEVGIFKPLLIPLWSSSSENVSSELNAYLDAVKKAPNVSGLVNAQFYHDVWYIPFLYQQNKVLVEGNPFVYK